MQVTAETELELVRRAKAGDSTAAGELLAGHEGILVSYAKRGGGDFDDKMQEVRLAVLKCLQTFDPDKGWRLMTYAARQMGWALNAQWWADSPVTVPRGFHNDENRKLAKKARLASSLDAPLGDGERTAASFLADGSDFGADVESNEETDRLRRAIDRLPKQMAYVIRERMAGKQLAEIGEAVGLSKSWINQIETMAHEQLKAILTSGIMERETRILARARTFGRWGKRWTESELDYTSTIKQCRILGLRKMNFIWTPERDEFLRSHRPDGWLETARLMGITPTAVHNRVRRLGIAQKRLAAGDFLTIKLMTTQGKTTTEIGAALGVSDECVRYNLKRFDMKAAGRNETKRMETVRRNMLAKYGVASVSERRMQIHRERAAALGHPELDWMTAAALHVFRSAGSMTIPQIAAGLRAFCAERNWKLRGTSNSIAYHVVAKLRKAGLVSRQNNGSLLHLFTLLGTEAA